jgi:hypothetical protein
MTNIFKIKWPSLNKEVRCRKIEHNQHIFDWWIEQLPIKALQGHTMAAGEALLLVSVPLNVPVNWEIRNESIEEIRLQKEGRLTIFMGNGTSTGIVLKYGKVTEDMKYPTFAEVIEDDLHILKEIGKKQWESILFTKKIILAEFTTMED